VERGRGALRFFVAAQARQRPEAIGLVDDERAYTYRELDERANRLAHRLAALGVRPGSLVAPFAEALARPTTRRTRSRGRP